MPEQNSPAIAGQNAKEVAQNTTMRISEKGLKLLKHYEGCELIGYMDSVGVPTIGYGNTFYENGVKVRVLDRITQERAESLLLIILDKFEKEVTRLTKGTTLKQCQFDALVCLAYNIGLGNFKTSTLLKKVKVNNADKTIEAEFMKWNKAGGKVLPGLTYRRRSEAYLYFRDEVKFFN